MTGRRSRLPEVTISEQGGVRYLHLDTPWVQGAMRIGRPRIVELEYVQRMLAWLLWRPQHELAHGHAVQLGLGAASLTRFTHRTLRMRTTAVELNPAVIAACRRWFRLGDDDERLDVVCADAGAWLRSAAAPRAKVSVLCVDLYDHEAAAPVLDDEGFYADCRALLAKGGVMSVNLFGRRASFERSMTRIAAAFGAGCLWHLAPTREGNTIAVATHAAVALDRSLWQARADNIEARYGLPARKWLRLLKAWPP
ncbi:MAG: Polyamine aminopropyltransferase [Burkholderiaceae bacterium]|nr:Polyamine aminopropyltransferase [Burkholderiaceae bacterium]